MVEVPRKPLHNGDQDHPTPNPILTPSLSRVFHFVLDYASTCDSLDTPMDDFLIAKYIPDKPISQRLLLSPCSPGVRHAHLDGHGNGAHESLHRHILHATKSTIAPMF